MPLSKGQKSYQTRQRNQIKFIQQTYMKYSKIWKKEDPEGYEFALKDGPKKVSFWIGFTMWLFKSGRVK
jgi:hypothetical protein|tara:strand:+ start:1413 stop:1619 length:207 start_codon:yes stop_codon:yes gene_type:complete